MSIDWPREQYEIRLEQNWSLFLRLCAVAAAILILTVTMFLTQADDRATRLIVVFLCGLLMVVSIFKSDVRWTVRSGEIQIERNWINGRQHVELVERADIIEIVIIKEPAEFGPRIWILLHRFSGRSVESPAAPNDIQAHELQIAVETRLNVIATVKQI